MTCNRGAALRFLCIRKAESILIDGDDSGQLTEESLPFRLRVDGKTLPLPINFQVGKQSRGVFVKMKNARRLAIEGAPSALTKGGVFSHFAKQVLQEVERRITGVFHYFLARSS